MTVGGLVQSMLMRIRSPDVFVSARAVRPAEDLSGGIGLVMACKRREDRIFTGAVRGGNTLTGPVRGRSQAWLAAVRSLRWSPVAAE